AAGDAGGAIGAALAAYHIHAGKPRQIRSATSAARDGMSGAYLGPSFGQSDIEERLKIAGARYFVLGEVDLLARTAKALAAGRAVGWFQGRMEFGPRALGNRSI